VSLETTKSPQIHHNNTTKNHHENTHFSQNPLQNTIPHHTNIFPVMEIYDIVVAVTACRAPVTTLGESPLTEVR
jgi:hypothetical protein